MPEKQSEIQEAQTAVVLRREELPARFREDLSVEDIKGQINKISELLKSVMIVDHHYGVIPGTDKPTLYKAGAEKINLMFHLAPKYRIEEIDLGGGHRQYTTYCDIYHAPTGMFMGSGIGICSTRERKYRFRKAARFCPECGTEAIIKGKEEYGGGWLCFAKKGGCGAKFSDDDQRILSQPVGEVEYEYPEDYYNTCVKISKKRSHIDATLTVSGASDLFAQDLEDLPEEIGSPPPKKQDNRQPPRQESRPTQQQQPRQEPRNNTGSQQQGSNNGNLDKIKNKLENRLMNEGFDQRRAAMCIDWVTVTSGISPVYFWNNYDETKQKYLDAEKSWNIAPGSAQIPFDDRQSSRDPDYDMEITDDDIPF